MTFQSCRPEASANRMETMIELSTRGEMGRPISPLKRRTATPEEALGAVITELRIKRKLSCQEVAAKVGYNGSHMIHIEHGTKNPTLKMLQAIASFHKIKLSMMFALAERKYERSQAAKKGVKVKTKPL